MNLLVSSGTRSEGAKPTSYCPSNLAFAGAAAAVDSIKNLFGGKLCSGAGKCVFEATTELCVIYVDLYAVGERRT